MPMGSIEVSTPRVRLGHLLDQLGQPLLDDVPGALGPWILRHGCGRGAGWAACLQFPAVSGRSCPAWALVQVSEAGGAVTCTGAP